MLRFASVLGLKAIRCAMIVNSKDTTCLHGNTSCLLAHDWISFKYNCTSYTIFFWSHFERFVSTSVRFTIISIIIIICLPLNLQMGLFSFLLYKYLIINITLIRCGTAIYSFAMNKHTHVWANESREKSQQNGNEKSNCILNVAIETADCPPPALPLCSPRPPFTRSFISIHLINSFFFHIWNVHFSIINNK